MTEWITVETADGPMRVYAARPDAPADRAVVVLQEAFGVNDHIQDITRRFATRGFLALAPDLFHRTGVTTLGYDQHAEAMPLIGAIGPDAITTDVSAVLDHLAIEGLPAARTAIVGFCFGGRAAFTTATTIPGLAATIFFYGPGIAAGPTPSSTESTRSTHRCSCTSAPTTPPSPPTTSRPSTPHCRTPASTTNNTSTTTPDTPSPATPAPTCTAPTPPTPHGHAPTRSSTGTCLRGVEADTGRRRADPALSRSDIQA